MMNLQTNCPGLMMVVGFQTSPDEVDELLEDEGDHYGGMFQAERMHTMDPTKFYQLVEQNAQVSVQVDLQPMSARGARELATAHIGGEIGDDLAVSFYRKIKILQCFLF